MTETKNAPDKQHTALLLGKQSAYLAACALHDVVPAVSEDMNLEALFRFCDFHSITAVVAMALEKAWQTQPADSTIMKKWREARDKAIRRNILMNAERERILEHLESIGCWYMPLKGSLLQYDYPKFGMRQMGDNDILIDPELSEQVYGFMLQSGYQCRHHNQGNHDEYSRMPVYNFEIHRALFKPETAPDMASYFRDIHGRSVRDEGNSFGWHLRDEDFYIYMAAHAYNHFRGSGIGIRHLMDVYVYTSRHTRLDWAYVERELESLGALEFDKCCRYLGNILFGQTAGYGQPVAEMEEMLTSFFESGRIGTQEQLLRKAMQKNTAQSSRIGYFFKRMFPDRTLLGVMYPSVRKRPWLIPFVWVYRLLRSLVLSPRRVFNEIASFFKRYQ